MEISEISVWVTLVSADGTTQIPVFTVSPRGHLSPALGDGVQATAQAWWFAAKRLCEDHGFKPPDPATSCRGPHSIIWPWYEEED